MSLTCRRCKAETVGVVLCKACRTTASMALANIATYHGEVLGAGHEFARIKRRAGSADPTLSVVIADAPRDSAAVTVALDTRNALVGWCRVLIDDRPGLAWPSDNVPAMAAFLRANLRTVAVLDWSGQMLHELLDLEHRLRRIVSAGRSGWSAGVCGAPTGDGPDDWCPNELVAHTNVVYVRCTSCGTRWPVEERRRLVLEAARDLLLPVALIAQALAALMPGEPSQQRLEARLRKWAERGVIEVEDVQWIDGRLRRVYRTGDVIDALLGAQSGISA